MSELSRYRDSRVRFLYPGGYRLEAVPEAGNYFLRRTKNISLGMIVLPRSIAGSNFDQMADGPSPEPDRRKKTVHNHYIFGAKSGKAITWEIFHPDGKLFSMGIQFFFEQGKWSALIDLDTRTPDEIEELERIVESLEIMDG
jgi:hypothetical protein